MIFILAPAFYISCWPIGKNNNIDSLSEAEALVLAVSLANEECFATYSERPFNENSYTIKFEDGRWRWGRVDLFGEHGFSATVSFDSWGKNKTVEVYFSVDYPRRVN